VSIAPRAEYAPLLASSQYRPRDEGGGQAVWSIVCFTIDRYAQRKGIASALLAAAVDHAFAHGASSVEAYPHVAKPDDYMGGTELYRRAGFAHVRDANKRAIVRLER
jgi:ribosomal protein S18 acetylase RimI-like enzyme